MLLFVMAIVKVFVFDLAELRGMPRIAAFMGLGILLLVLSYAYQRVAPRFLDAKEPAA